MKYELHYGDNLEWLRKQPDNSVDSIATDPPYGLGKEPDAVKMLQAWLAEGYLEVTGRGFMGKGWDAFVPQPIFWKEVFRVLKPGGHVVSFAGTRTYDWMVMAMRLAGFEIRDQLIWMYGGGFCKSHNLRRDPICNCRGNAVPCDHESESETEYDMRLLPSPDLSEAERYGSQSIQGLQPHLQQQNEGYEPSSNGGGEGKGEKIWGDESRLGGRDLHRTRQGLPNDKDAESSEVEGQRLRLGAHIGSGKDAREDIDGNGGGASHQQGEDGQQAGEFEDLRDSLGALDGGALSQGRGACPRCGKLKEEYVGFGTALSPSHEPIALARKPLEKGLTIAQNVLKWGTGALNIDGCRVGTREANESGWSQTGSKAGENTSLSGANYAREPKSEVGLGRWPSNLLLANVPSVIGLFPENAKSGAMKHEVPAYEGESMFFNGRSGPSNQYGDSGSASRYFFRADLLPIEIEEQLTIDQKAIYCSKPSKYERSLGKGTDDSHETVKPVALMHHLVTLITPPNGICVDPYCGSGTTGIAAMLGGFRFVGLEMTSEYIPIATNRIKNWKHYRQFVEAKKDDTPSKKARETTKAIQQSLF